jgi:small subunit ribosomal protein S5
VVKRDYNKNRRHEEEREEWVPKTDLGRKVMSKEIISVDQIFEMGKPILEHQIVDALVPNLKDDVIEVSMTQRMTDCGRKSQFRAIVIVGDSNGHVGIGAGKADETRPAIETGIKHAKRNLIKVPLGCGSWECGCGKRHTIPIKVIGHNGSVVITLKPAPKGVGIVSNEVVKKVLALAGVKDAWAFSRGKTSNVYNSAMAVYKALDSLNHMKFTGSWESKFEEETKAPAVAAAQENPEAEAKTEEVPKTG